MGIFRQTTSYIMATELNEPLAPAATDGFGGYAGPSEMEGQEPSTQTQPRAAGRSRTAYVVATLGLLAIAAVVVGTVTAPTGPLTDDGVSAGDMTDSMSGNY